MDKMAPSDSTTEPTPAPKTEIKPAPLAPVEAKPTAEDEGARKPPPAGTGGNGSPPGPASRRGVTRDDVTPPLSLILGALVLVPVTTGQLLRPYVWELLLPTFVMLASIAAVLLILAVILTGLCKPTSNAPAISRGVGTCAGITALFALVAFLAANYCDHLFAPPEVLNVKLAPVPLVAGKVAEADIEVLNKSAKQVHYEWAFNGQPVEGMHTAYFRLPDAPGRYPLEVRLRLDSPRPMLEGLLHTSSAPRSFKTFVEVVKDESAPTQVAAPIVIPCCKGVEHETANQKCKCRAGTTATDAKPPAGRR